MIRKYKRGDWEEIDDAVEPFVPPQVEVDFADASARGLSVTGLEDDEVVACGGIIFLSDEEGFVWLKVSKKCEGSYRWARTVMEVFGMMKKAVGDLNICTYVLEGFERGGRLAEKIGFRRTIKTMNHNGHTYIRYSSCQH